MNNEAHFVIAIKNQKVAEFAIIMDRLVERYPGRSLLQIIWDAGDFCGRSGGLMRHLSTSDMLKKLSSYLNTHD